MKTIRWDAQVLFSSCVCAVEMLRRNHVDAYCGVMETRTIDGLAGSVNRPGWRSIAGSAPRSQERTSPSSSVRR